MADHFDDVIRQMEMEVTALKTAHTRALGAVDFYSKSASTSITTSVGFIAITVIAKTAAGELTPGFEEPQITVSYDGLLTMDAFNVSGDTSTWEYSAALPKSSVTATVNVKVISASKLSSLQVTAAEET